MYKNVLRVKDCKQPKYVHMLHLYNKIDIWINNSQAKLLQKKKKNKTMLIVYTLICVKKLQKERRELIYLYAKMSTEYFWNQTLKMVLFGRDLGFGK